MSASNRAARSIASAFRPGTRAAIQVLRLRAAEKDADAVIGIDLDYTEFSSNRIGLILSGTMVKLARADANVPPPL